MIDHDAFGIAAVGDAAGVFVLTIIIQSFLATWTTPARIDHATDRRQIALFEFLYLAPNLDHAPNDLMTGHARVSRAAAPFISHDMQVRVTNPAEKNFNLHIRRRRITPLEREWFQRLVGRMGGITFGRKHRVYFVRR